MSIECHACGTTQDSSIAKCISCGVNLSATTLEIPTNMNILFKQRSYIPWAILLIFMAVIPNFILGFLFKLFFPSFIFFTLLGILSAIPYGYYIYLNFKDFNILYQRTHGFSKNLLNPTIMGILYLLPYINIVVMGLKFYTLNKHLRTEHGGETTYPFNTIAVVIAYILPVIIGMFVIQFIESSFFIFYSIFILAFFIFSLYTEFTWQKALNTHIRNHLSHLNPN